MLLHRGCEPKTDSTLTVLTYPLDEREKERKKEREREREREREDEPRRHHCVRLLSPDTFSVQATNGSRRSELQNIQCK